MITDADEFECPEGAVPADTLQATDGDEVAGVTQGGAQVGGKSGRHP